MGNRGKALKNSLQHRHKEERGRNGEMKDEERQERTSNKLMGIKTDKKPQPGSKI